MSLEIKNLHVSVGKKEIVKGISLTINPGEIHVIMGPNGSGKSTFSNAIMGHPKYSVKGKILVNGKNVTKLPPDKKAKAGLFLSMQNAPEIPGITVSNFLRVATGAMSGKSQNPFTFHESLKKQMTELGIDFSFAARYLNTGFSGGEKKRMEILQLIALDPAYAILDEADSGLDVDALKMVGKGINTFAQKKKGLLIITHYTRLLEYVKPDFVHVMVEGRIVKSGGAELAREIEKNGYENINKV